MLKVAASASLSEDFMKWFPFAIGHANCRPVLLPAMRLREVAPAEISEVPELRLAERAVSAQFLTRAMIIVPFPVSACDKSTAYIPV